MNDHDHDHELERADFLDRPDEVPAPAPAVLIVTQRSGWGVARLVPPLLIVLIGTVFLAYRSTRADGRGLAFDSWPWPTVSWRSPTRPQPTPGPTVATSPTRPAVESRVSAAVPTPKAQVEPEPEPVPEPVENDKAREKEKGKDAVDPLADIAREAEATRSRVAELERLKEQESKKLDETARERQLADRQERFGRRLGRGMIAPAEVEALLKAHREQFQRQMERFAEIQGQHMKEFADLQREFFNGQFPPQVRGWDFGFDPGGFRQGPAPAPGGPGGLSPFGQIPPGARIREFRGPGGLHGFELRWGISSDVPGNPGTTDDVPPPPPVPARIGRRNG